MSNQNDEENKSKKEQKLNKLDEKNLEIALKALCVNLRETTSRNYSYAVCKQPRSSRQLNALQWLLPQVVDLKLFELPEKVTVYYKKPVRQCLYCGKPDFYIRNNKQIALQVGCDPSVVSNINYGKAYRD